MNFGLSDEYILWSCGRKMSMWQQIQEEDRLELRYKCKETQSPPKPAPLPSNPAPPKPPPKPPALKPPAKSQYELNMERYEEWQAEQGKNGLLIIRAAAQEIGASEDTVRNAVTAGQIPYVTMTCPFIRNAVKMVRRSDVEQWNRPRSIVKHREERKKNASKYTVIQALSTMKRMSNTDIWLAEVYTRDWLLCLKEVCARTATSMKSIRWAMERGKVPYVKMRCPSISVPMYMLHLEDVQRWESSRNHNLERSHG